MDSVMKRMVGQCPSPRIFGLEPHCGRNGRTSADLCYINTTSVGVIRGRSTSVIASVSRCSYTAAAAAADGFTRSK